MTEGVFLTDGDRVTATPHGRGPWDPQALHGGAPAALLAAAFERMPAPPQMSIARLDFVFLRPIPFSALRLSTRLVRSGRRVQELAGELVVFVLAGVICFAALGVAFAHVIPNFESTAAYVNAVFLPVVFLSFYVFDSSSAPSFLRHIAEALPLLPLIEGIYAAIVRGSGLGDHLDELAVIGLWAVFGLYLAVRGFSWEKSDS